MADSGGVFKAAVVQAAPIFLDRDGTIKRVFSQSSGYILRLRAPVTCK